MATLLKGDCIELMKRLRKGSVDLILCDLPYGITDCRWDKKIPLAPLWKSYDRVLKDDGAVLLFAQQPFATHLAANASVSLKLRYEWIWDKGAVTGFQNANRMPMRRHENIFVFYRRLPSYHPQGLVAARIHVRRDVKRWRHRGVREDNSSFKGFHVQMHGRGPAACAGAGRGDSGAMEEAHVAFSWV